MKRIDELSDCTAYIVLNKKGEHVATVNYRYGSGGGVQCDVFQRDELVHQKKAGGYGYDKITAALAGAVIDGYRIADHCGHAEAAGEKARARLIAAYKRNPAAHTYQDWSARASRIGCRWANGMESLFFSSGLDRLSDLGYRVLRAL